MRLRNVSGSREALQENQFVIDEPQCYKNKWRELFGNNHPLHIEIGMGKGKFILQLARENPDINYIGIEKYSSVLIRAIEKLNEYNLPNIYFIRMDATEILEVFGEYEVDKIYLNFSDPWPKDRHAKRRLTSKEFFQRYDKILKKQSVVEFKTDNIPLFDFSLEQIPLANWKVEAYTRDLHHSPMNNGNVMTEYEEKFSSMGHPIGKLIASR